MEAATDPKAMESLLAFWAQAGVDAVYARWQDLEARANP